MQVLKSSTAHPENLTLKILLAREDVERRESKGGGNGGWEGGWEGGSTWAQRS